MHRPALISFFAVLVASCNTHAMSPKILPSSADSDTNCKAGDIIEVEQISRDNAQVPNLPDRISVLGAYLVTSKSCRLSVRGFVPQGYPYVISANQVGAKINLNIPYPPGTRSPLIVEALDTPAMREIPVHCGSLEVAEWRSTTTIADCVGDDEHLDQGITYGIPFHGEIASIGAFRSTGPNSVILIYGFADLSNLRHLGS